MPAFGKTHPPNEIWSIVAFVRHLPALTPEEKKELSRKEPGEPHGEIVAPPSPQGGTGGGGANEHVHEVAISGFQFVPPTLEVHVGDTIEWKNADFVDHTATADDRAFDTGRVQAGETKRIVAKEKGRFPYFCRYHSAMKGAVIVQ